MPKDADAFFRALEQGDPPAVVAFGGEERVFVDEALAIVRARALQGGLADFNHDRVSLRERTLAEALSAAATLPLMSPRRLVEVRDAELLKESDLERLEAYLDAPSPTTTVCFVFDQIDLREKAAKLIDKKALMARFEHPKERDMPGLAARRGKKHKLSLDHAAAEALAITVGTDLTLLERALEKLALVAEGGKVTVDDVSTHVADTHMEDAFGLGRAVAKADRGDALQRIAALEAGRDAAPLQLIGLLAWQLRQVLRAHAMLDDGAHPDDVGRELRVFGDRQHALITAARRFDAAGHARRLERLAETDRALKSSRAPPWLIMAKLVIELCPVLPPKRPASGRPGAGLPGSGGGGGPAVGRS